VFCPADKLPVGLTRECECESTTNIGDRLAAIPNNFPSDQLALTHVLYGLYRCCPRRSCQSVRLLKAARVGMSHLVNNGWPSVIKISVGWASNSSDLAVGSRLEVGSHPSVERVSFTYYAGCSGGVQGLAARARAAIFRGSDLIRRGWKDRADGGWGQGGPVGRDFG
jgi:hypothetical protein